MVKLKTESRGNMSKKFWLFIAILCVFLACLCVNYDYDFFARLIVGENFIENGVLPYKDFVSYTPTHSWYDHEWGSGIIFYLILKYLGALGILVFYALMLFGTTYFVVKAQKLQRHAYPTSIIFTAVFLILFAHVNPTLVRCHLFTFFFFSMFLYILEKERKQSSKLIWVIPPIIVFWNNVHGGVVSGLGLLLMYALGEFLNRKPWKKYLKPLVVSLPLLFINPYGIKYIKFLLSATTMKRKYVIEWWPFFADRHIIYYMLPSLFLIFGLILNVLNSLKSKKPDYTKLIVLFVTVAEGLWHVKLLSLGIISVSILCYNDICRIFRKFKFFMRSFEKSIYYVVLFLMFLIPLFSPQIPRANYYAFPLYEVEFLKINNIKGNIVTPFGLGSYAAYKLFPDNLIYMDGRYEEVYPNNVFTALRDFELAEENWNDIIKFFNTDILMPAKNVEIYEVLKHNPNWVHIFDGMLCGIFVKKEKVKPLYIEPEYDINYYRRTMFSATYFGKNLKGKKQCQIQ